MHEVFEVWARNLPEPLRADERVSQVEPAGRELELRTRLANEPELDERREQPMDGRPSQRRLCCEFGKGNAGAHLREGADDVGPSGQRLDKTRRFTSTSHVCLPRSESTP